MSSYLQSLGIDRLSTDERIVLVQEIWDSIAAEDASPPLTDAQKAELRRRVAHNDAHPDDTVPWEVARQRIIDRLNKPA